jgi:hypothetical protein
MAHGRRLSSNPIAVVLSKNADSSGMHDTSFGVT